MREDTSVTLELPDTHRRRRLPAGVASLAVLAVSAGLVCGGVSAPATAAPAPVASAGVVRLADSTIASGPEDQVNVRSGRWAYFSAYSFDDTATAVWEESTDGGASFHPLPDTIAVSDQGSFSEIDIETVTYAMNGRQYRAVFTGTAEDTSPHTTDAATLTVVPAVSVNDQYDNHLGQAATFTATPEEGAPALTFTWQRGVYDETTEEMTWETVPGSSGLTYTTPATSSADSGTYYRGHYSLDGETFYDSDAGYLYVDASPFVSTQPEDHLDVLAGTPTSFVAHSGNLPDATVQWQVSHDDGVNWEDVDGATEDTFTLNPTLADAGLYQAYFSNDEDGVASESAVLSVTGSVPSAARHIVATQTGPGEVTVTWDAPEDPGTPATVTGYGVGWGAGEYGDGGNVDATTFTKTFTGLGTGRYVFSVLAMNAAGQAEPVRTGWMNVLGNEARPTVSVSENDAVAGQRLTVSGTATPYSQVVIDRALPGQGYRALSSVWATGSGRYSATFTVVSSATYRARAANGLASAGRYVSVESRMTLGAKRAAARTYTLSGTVYPAVSGQVVAVQVRRPNGTYAGLARVRTDRAGHWSFTHRYAARTYTFRAVSARTALNDAQTITRRVSVR